MAGAVRFPVPKAFEDCPRRRQNFSVATRSRTNVPASIAVIAMRIAATAVPASKRVTLFSSFLPPMTFTGLPSARRMLARHLPGSRSNVCRTNRLYSMSDTTEIFDGIKIVQKGKRYVAKKFDSLAHIRSKRDEGKSRAID